MKYKNYIRVTRSAFNREFIIGVQFFSGENVKELRDDVKRFMDICIDDFTQFPLEGDENYASVIHTSAQFLYPNREHFLEIGDDKDSWIQICPPEEIYVTN